MLPASVVVVGPEDDASITKDLESLGTGSRCCAGYGANRRKVELEQRVGGLLALTNKDWRVVPGLPFLEKVFPRPSVP